MAVRSKDLAGLVSARLLLGGWAVATGCGPEAARAGSLDAGSAEASTAAMDAAEPTVEVEATTDPRPLVVPARYIEENATMQVLEDGDAIDLWAAPQGGHVALVGAKIKNFPTNVVTILGRLRRLDDGRIVQEEARTVAMVPAPDEEGYWQPDLRSPSQVANVPLCPDYDSFDIVDQTFLLEVTVTPSHALGAVGTTATRRVIPSCTQPDTSARSFCRCECTAGYVLGRCGSYPTSDASQR